MNQTPADAPPVLITDCDHSDTDTEAAVLEQAGLGWRLGQYASESELIDGGAGARVLINQYTPITAAVLDALPQVQLVVRYGVGVDSVDVAAATERSAADGRHRPGQRGRGDGPRHGLLDGGRWRRDVGTRARGGGTRGRCAHQQRQHGQQHGQDGGGRRPRRPSCAHGCSLPGRALAVHGVIGSRRFGHGAMPIR